MLEAIEIGKLGKDLAGDNPYVGCVIWKDGTIIGSGHTKPPGGPHAEVSAWLSARDQGHDVAGATLYTTVEPCSFHGRTPACASSIVSWGIRRVVIGIRDPHPKVNGEGIAILKRAGIEVDEGVCAKQVGEYLGSWLSALTQPRAAMTARSDLATSW